MNAESGSRNEVEGPSCVKPALAFVMGWKQADYSNFMAPATRRSPHERADDEPVEVRLRTYVNALLFRLISIRYEAHL
jgi:hypothetical protein